MEKRPTLATNKGFRWLCIGSTVSMLGDQLTLISLPWLALYLSQDPWVLGSLLATLALPMSVLMLVGGAIVDRYSAKSVLLFTKYCSAIFMGTIALLLICNGLTLPMLYVLAFLVGCCSAFAIPAGSSLLPHVVQPEQLPMANSIGMTLRACTNLIGPLLAAALLGLESTNADHAAGQPVSQRALSVIFLLDTMSFLASAFLLLRVSVMTQTRVKQGLKASLAEGLLYFWKNAALRQLVLYIALITSFLGGMMQVGLPLLVSSQWQAGASLFGVMMAAMAGGNIAGMFLASQFQHKIPLSLGQTLLSADIIVGLLLIGMANLHLPHLSIIILVVLGILSGYVQVLFISWIQQQASGHLLGRLMSIVMFGMVGLAPLSTSMTGALLQFIPVNHLFIAAGAGLFLVASLAFVFSNIASIEGRPEFTDRTGTIRDVRRA